MYERDPDIKVSVPSLPDLDIIKQSLDDMWNSKFVTNFGKYHEQLEREIAQYLNVPYVTLFSSGTTALIAALSVLKVRGDVITTPFTFSATTQAVKIAGLNPVPADINLDTYNLDPRSVEGSISRKTKVILPVHCYGTPCDLKAFSCIAKKHNLYLVYDASHSFGVKGNEYNIFSSADLSAISLHATKVFHTVEGGCVVYTDEMWKQPLELYRNFGLTKDKMISGVGLNGKMNEICAAIGLANLRTLEDNIKRRLEITRKYNEVFTTLSHFVCPPIALDFKPNGSYYPIRIKSDAPFTRTKLSNYLLTRGIETRPYFSPLTIKSNKSERLNLEVSFPNAKIAEAGILCLPLHSNLSNDEVNQIINSVKRAHDEFSS